MENTTEQPQSEAEQPPPEAPRQRRLVRRSENRVLGGVASGIADHLQVDPWLIRAVFIVLTFAGGCGLVLYLLGVFTIPTPTDPVGSSPFEKMSARQGRYGWWPWVVLGLAVLALTNGFGSNGSILWPLLLIGLGVYLLREQPVPENAPVESVPERSPPQAGITTPAYGGAPAPVLVRPKRERSALFPLIFGLALLAAAITGLLVQSDTIELEAQQVLAIPMIVLGIGALVGAWIGRGRWLVLPALMLLPFLAAASIADSPFHTRTGVHEYRPASIGEVQHEYTLGAGKMIVDLSQVRTTGDSFSVKAEANAGEIVVVVPKDVAAKVKGRAGAGVVEVLGNRDDGRNASVTQVFGGAGGTLDIDAHTGFGHIFVTDNPNAAEARR